MDWHELYEKVTPYIVSVMTPQGRGTGFLFAYNANRSLAAFATAAHVVDHAHDWKEPIKFRHHNSGEELFLPDEQRVVFLDRIHDSASIVLLNKGLPLPKDVLPLAPQDKFLKIGIEVGWAGFPSIAYTNLCFFSGRVSNYLADESSYLIDGVAINGVSGGPVFAETVRDKPHIIGTISAYIPNRNRGEALPGLLRARDVTSFHETIEKINSLDDARKQEQEQAKQALQGSEDPKSQ